MNLQTANVLNQFGGEIHESYSGRSMYGKTTAAIEFDSEEEFFKALSYVMIECEEEEREDVGGWLSKAKTDNMGKGFIYY